MALAAASAASFAQDNCANRGDLDSQFCDANKDLVADTPTDAKKLKDPSTLVFAFTPVEDPSIYEKLFRPFMGHLSQCVGKKVVFFPVQSNAAQIEAMRSGRLHIAAFSPGPVNFAVNLAGAVPFAIRGNDQGPVGMNLKMIVQKGSSYQKLDDLKGKRIAHTSPSSNSGNLAPRALFPKLGITPDKDYKVVYSGKHDQSILGVKTGDYDAAPVASDVLQHMTDRGVVGKDDFRVLYTSEMFPTDAYAFAYNLAPALQEKIKGCFFDYKVPAEMAKGLGGDRFLPITYKKDWQLVRDVAQASGESFTREAFDKAAQKK
ncbi:phosphate/phosphite/phosphonate ABC transporter substrate-binding protein [Diaphorobacter sp. HDW4B]|uniref:phosphate/phosphite/phosphonate ABC transporter substrate-binding protein n=1 Tax=Diaphorobacter sp. HDW4B TaxID=2714925 RepID=UPI00197AFC1A|nr:phosphate/phosphite/phosphonate ABC transporter substrate-binding protein [Diaphorobacter sp. HDW4B]